MSAPSGALDTARPGVHTYTVTATSSDGHTGTASMSYVVAGAVSAVAGAPSDSIESRSFDETSA